MTSKFLQYRGALYRRADVVACGQCFHWANQVAQDDFDDDLGRVVVHAWVRNPEAQEYPGRRRWVEHAWIEDDRIVWDWQHVVLRRQGGVPKAEFYAEYRPRDVHRYSFQEALIKLLRNRHHGPWDLGPAPR